MNKQTEIEKVVRKESLIKIAIDMHWKSYRVVRQIDHSEPQPGQKFRPEAIFGWLEKQRGLAERVVVCYEAGCFGYEPARQMQAMGRRSMGLRRRIGMSKASVRLMTSMTGR